MAGSDRNPELRRLIPQFYAKSMEVILESRFPSSSPVVGAVSTPSSSAQQSKGASFNLAMGKFASMAEKMEPWCRSVLEPMVIDIFYVEKGGKRATVEKLGNVGQIVATPGSLKAALEASDLKEQAILLERWTVEFIKLNGGSSSKVERESGKGFIGRYIGGTQHRKYRISTLRFKQGAGASDEDVNEVAGMSLEKNLCMLVRSLYSTARLLPAHSLSRLLSTAGKLKSKLVHRVLTTPPPLSNSDKNEMTLLCFPHFDCHCGHLQISVAYRQTVPIEEHKMPSHPPQIITDYVDKVANHKLKQSPIDNALSLLSTPCPPSSETIDHQESMQPAIKEKASTGGERETFDCPFAIDDVHGRTEPAAKLTSDMEVHGIDLQEGASSGSVLSLLRTPDPLSHTKKIPFPRKTAANALKEFKMYIDYKDNLLSKCT